MKRLIFFLSFQIFSFSCISQILVQLEIFDDPRAIKYGPGDVMSYKTTDYDGWLSEKIEKVDYENKIIVFTRGYEYLDNITHIRREKAWVKNIGKMLMRFSAAWFLYGGIATLVDDYEWGVDTALIGGGALVTGFILNKIGGTKIYNVKGKDRLRIIDITWPEPRN